MPSRADTSHVVDCPICGSVATWTTFTNASKPVGVKGVRARVSGLSGHECSACGEILFDQASAARFAEASDAQVLEARRRAGEELRRIRKRLRMTQVQASALAGGGHNAFSRYETGAAQPVPAVFHLFHLLDQDPSRLKELEEAPRFFQRVAASGAPKGEHPVKQAASRKKPAKSDMKAAKGTSTRPSAPSSSKH